MTEITARLHGFITAPKSLPGESAQQLAKDALAEINRLSNKLMLIRNAIDDGERKYPEWWPRDKRGSDE